MPWPSVWPVLSRTPGNFDRVVWTEPILHVDMDSFFVEVERLDDSRLVGVPAAVGGTGPRGVIASASYEARRFGVRSAQPTATALRMCPDLVVVSPSHRKYREASVRVFGIFREFTPLVEGLSLDEAYLDVSGLRRHFGSAVDVGERLRSEVRARLGLPSSVGIAANKLVAKLASEAAKPDGLWHVPREGQQRFLSELPSSSLPGVGPATLASLQRLGVATVGEIAELPEAVLARALGPTLGRQLLDLASGHDRRRVEPDQEAKSVSVEETYATDLQGGEVIKAALADLSHRLSMRLRRSGLVARTITLKARYPDFETVTRSRTGEPTDSWRRIFATVGNLLGDLPAVGPVRLLGLSGSGLQQAEAPRQIGLDEDSWSRAEEAVFEVRERFGDGSILPGRGLGETR
jgi:DNA polymerase IV